MAGITNRGKRELLDFLRGDTPTNLFMALCTSANTPDADTNKLSDLTEIQDGQGYTAGGYSLNLDSTDLDNLTEHDSLDRGSIQFKDIIWTASGGTLPASGDGARWAVLVDDQSDPNVWAYFDMTSDRQVSDGQDLKLENCEIRLNES